MGGGIYIHTHNRVALCVRHHIFIVNPNVCVCVQSGIYFYQTYRNTHYTMEHRRVPAPCIYLLFFDIFFFLYTAKKKSRIYEHYTLYIVVNIFFFVYLAASLNIFYLFNEFSSSHRRIVKLCAAVVFCSLARFPSNCVPVIRFSVSCCTPTARASCTIIYRITKSYTYFYVYIYTSIYDDRSAHRIYL